MTTIEKITTQGKNQKDTVSGATQVTKYTRLILQQADIANIEEIPNLPDHQKAAKDQSNVWINTIWPHIIKTTADIIDYANTFQATYKELLSLVPALEKGDEEAKKNFIQALNGALVPTLEEKQSSSKQTADTIYKFSADFNDLYLSFQADFTKANKLMTKDNEELIEKQADATKYKIEAQSWEYVAVGAGVAIPMTLAGTAFFAETGVGAIIGGLIMLGELATIIAALTKYAQAMSNYNDAMKDIDKLHKQVATLTAIEHQITGLQSNSQTVSTAAASVADGWVALSADLQDTINHLQGITPEDAAILIKIDLDAANKEWAVVLEQAKTLQPNGGKFDNQNYETSDEMVDAIHNSIKGA